MVAHVWYPNPENTDMWILGAPKTNTLAGIDTSTSKYKYYDPVKWAYIKKARRIASGKYITY